MANVDETLRRYEAALEQIARRVEEQIALEEHQRRVGLPTASINFGRLDTYNKIFYVAGEALGRGSSSDAFMTAGKSPLQMGSASGNLPGS